MDKHCSIVVLNYNGHEDSIACINSLHTHLKGNYNIILVDNNSTDQSVEFFKAHKDNPTWNSVVLIQSSKNGGFSYGNNLGIVYGQKHFKSDYYWILNNDTLITEDALSPLIAFYEKHDDIGILGSLLKFNDQREIIQAIGGRMNKFSGKFEQIGFNKKMEEINQSDTDKLDFVIGASLFVGNSFIEKVGLLEEEYFLYYEEIDWSLRAKKQGLDTAVCLDSLVYHKQGNTTGNKVNAKKNSKAMYFQFKNLILLYRKFYPGLIWVSYLMVTLRCIKFAITDDLSYLALWFKVVFKKRVNHFE